MQAGKLRCRVTLQAPTVTKDARGQDVTSWTDVLECWADVRQLMAKEGEAGQQIRTSAAWRVVMRWQPELAALTTRHRVLYAGRTLDITAWNNVAQRNEMVQIDATEHQD